VIVAVMARIGMWLLAGTLAGGGAGWWCGRHWPADGAARPPAAPAAGRAAAEQELVRAQQAQLAAQARDQAAVAAQLRAWAARCASAEAELAELRRAAPAAGDRLPAPGAETLTGAPIRVVDVNAPLGMLVVDAGREQGVRAGMCFGVVHGRALVADVRVTEVRAAVSGVIIEQTYGGQRPVAGDRLVPRPK